MTDSEGIIVQATLKSGVLQENIPFFEGAIYYINAELFYNSKSLGERRLDVIGQSSIVFDERIKPNLSCKVEINRKFVLLNIIFE
jgi:hypothetical protein